jgi:hypothetical protein
MSDADESYRHFWNSLIVRQWDDEISPQPWLTRLVLCDSLIQNNGLLYWLEEEEEEEGDLDAMVDACIRLGLDDVAAHLQAVGIAVDNHSDPISDDLAEQFDRLYFALSDLIGPAVRRWWEANEVRPPLDG